MSETLTIVSKWGNSIGVRIPARVAAVAGITDGSTLAVTSTDGVVTLRKVSEQNSHTLPHYSLARLLQGVTPKTMNKDAEWLDTIPVGREAL